MGLREHKKEKARADILAAATELVQRRGFDETTMRDIADAAHVSHQTLYNYFPSKASVFRALLGSETEPLVAELAAIAVSSDGDLLGALDRGFKAIFDRVGDGDRRIWREIFAQAIRGGAEHTGFFEAYYAGAQERLIRMVENAKARGRLRPDTDAKLLAETLYAIVDFALLSFVLRPREKPRTALARVRAQVGLLVTPYLSVSESKRRRS